MTNLKSNYFKSRSSRTIVVSSPTIVSLSQAREVDRAKSEKVAKTKIQDSLVTSQSCMTHSTEIVRTDDRFLLFFRVSTFSLSSRELSTY